VGEIAAKAVVQLLFSTGKSFTVDGLREKLREFYRQEVRAELRAVASLNNVELITALISCNRQLGLVGLQLRILNGVVSLLTTEVHNNALAQYLSQQSGAIGSLDLTTATLEVLACIAFKATPNLFAVRSRAVMHYNFCRIHQSLRVTHAIESGVTDHVWSSEEVVAILVDRR
jgi:hypothetical protein